MTIGLKIHKMMKEENADPPELQDEAKRRRDMSDSILEIIYNKIVNKKPKQRSMTEEEDNECWD